MFINNINHNINAKINFSDIDLNTKKNNNEPNNFFDHIKTALKAMSSIQNHAKIDAEKFVLNQPGISLNDVMINLQKSSISLQMAIQIRNKIVSAYQEIMNQQI